MEANVSSVTAGMSIFAKYNSQARVEFWDGYMVVFAVDIGEMSEADTLYLLRLGWKEPEPIDTSHIPEYHVATYKQKIAELSVWEYGL